MSRAARDPGLLLDAVLLAACGGSTAQQPRRRHRRPSPATRESPAPTTPGHGPGRHLSSPVRNAAYRLERHDSLSLQYPGGATQEQVRDRIAFLHVTLTETLDAGRRIR